MHRYLPLLLFIGLAWGQRAVFNPWGKEKSKQVSTRDSAYQEKVSHKISLPEIPIYIIEEFENSTDYRDKSNSWWKLNYDRVSNTEEYINRFKNLPQGFKYVRGYDLATESFQVVIDNQNYQSDFGKFLEKHMPIFVGILNATAFYNLVEANASYFYLGFITAWSATHYVINYGFYIIGEKNNQTTELWRYSNGLRSLHGKTNKTRNFFHTGYSFTEQSDIELKIRQILDSSYPNWIDLHKKLDYYNSLKYIPRTEDQNTSSTILSEIHHLGRPKGEFETTIQYNERIKQQGILIDEKELQHKQALKLQLERFEISKLKLAKEIETLADNFYLEVDYPFDLSTYDADLQEFEFHIFKGDSFERKKLKVSITEAPHFKKNAFNLAIKDKVKPSVNGSWVSVYNDVKLYDGVSQKVIPWDDSFVIAETTTANPPLLTANINLKENSGEGFLDPEEKVEIKIVVKNNGKGAANSVRLSLIQNSGPTLYYDVSKIIDQISPNQEKSATFPISIPENVQSGKVDFTISFIESYGFEPDPIHFTAEVRSHRIPELSVVDFGVTDSGMDGRVSRGETAEIKARIQNRGQGKAKNVKIKILQKKMIDVFLAPFSEKDFDLGDIDPGDAKDINFTILTNNRVGDVANIILQIDEKREQYSLIDEIQIEIDKKNRQLKRFTFDGINRDITINDIASLKIDIEENIPSSRTINENGVGIVFGIEKYRNVSDVTFAKRDATYIFEYFEKVLNLPPEKIYYKTNEEVGQAEFKKVFSKGGWIDKRIKKNSNLYFYFAGHGAPSIDEGKGYLIPYDGDPNYASQTGYGLDELYSELNRINAKSTTVFLDACFSGSNRNNEMILANARPIVLKIDKSYTYGINIFTASESQQISSSWPEKKHGIFSYFLMKGMKGKADENNDKKLTFGELGNYIQTNVSNTAGLLDREQTPSLSTQNKSAIFISY